MKVLYERVAGIDVHKDMVKVAIRSPGEKPWTRKTEVLEFRTFYGVLQEMARELRRRGVTHVVMEASGVYTEPVYYALCEQDFTEVAVINPAHAKALKGHKNDARACARPAELLECGLLDGSSHRAGWADRRQGGALAARGRPAHLRSRLWGRGGAGLAGRDRPRPAPVLRHLPEAGLLGHAMSGEQHQRPQAQARPDRGRRDLHQ